MINDRICTCMLLKLWKCEKMIKAVKKCACVLFYLFFAGEIKDLLHSKQNSSNCFFKGGNSKS